MKLIASPMIVIFSVIIAMAVALFAYAQSTNSSLIINAPLGPFGSCPTPAVNSYIQCPTTDKGLQFSFGGAPYFQVQAQVGGGVASFNGRTGSVLPSPGDYRYADLANPPTTVTCTNFSVVNGTFSGTNCTIK